METGDGTQLLRDLADIRSIVEPTAAHRAARYRTADDLTALETALDAMGQAQIDSAAAEADAAFHRALLAVTGNEPLRRMGLLLEPGLRERDRAVHVHGDAVDPVPSHRAVLDAIRDQGPDRAEFAMLDLLAKAVRDLENLARPSGNTAPLKAEATTRRNRTARRRHSRTS
ncbi:FCD domain-containing protein [Streptomyces atroolivaceus]|uniref:FadR/GntR family transcriptional regulator n=1 Tax=Streptomyces atroolivaceus TaxID=66869 RepID=UPI0033EB6B57